MYSHIILLVQYLLAEFETFVEDTSLFSTINNFFNKQCNISLIDFLFLSTLKMRKINVDTITNKI